MPVNPSCTIVEFAEPSIFGETCGYIVDDEQGTLATRMTEIAEDSFPKLPRFYPSTFVVAFDSTSIDSRQVMGFCAISTDTVFGVRGMHIEMMCVAPRYRRQGVGRSIIDAAMGVGVALNEKQTDGRLVNCRLEVSKDKHSNDHGPVVAFYKSCGFVVEDRRGYSDMHLHKTL